MTQDSLRGPTRNTTVPPGEDAGGAAEPVTFTLALIGAGEAEVADFLVSHELAGRVDNAEGTTSVLLVDLHFRPIGWDPIVATALAVATGQAVTLLAGDLGGSSGSAAAVNDLAPVVRGQLHEPDGRIAPLPDEQLRRALAVIPGRAVSADEWLVIGRVPQRSLHEIISRVLPAHGRVQVNLWQERDWFLAQLVDPGQPATGGNPDDATTDARPVLAVALAAAVRGGRRDPVVVVRHNDCDTAIMQPGVSDWEDFVLEWGMHRTWVHPRWGVAVVDQDAAVSQFVKHWQRAGGRVDPVNLRALSRRRGMRGTVLRPVLGCLDVPTQITSRAVAVTAGDHPVGVHVVRGSGIGRSRKRGARVGRRSAGTPAVLRVLLMSGLIAGSLLAYQLASLGPAGRPWASLVGLALVTAGGVASGVGMVRSRRSHGRGLEAPAELATAQPPQV